LKLCMMSLAQQRQSRELSSKLSASDALLSTGFWRRRYYAVGGDTTPCGP
jgi:hypothetical protein